MCKCSLTCDDEYLVSEHLHTSCTCTEVVIPVTDLYITDTDLDLLKSELQLLYAKNAGWFNHKRFGILGKCNNDLFKLMHLYVVFLNYWTQWPDGTTTGIDNYMTRQEFSRVVNQVKNIIGSTQIY
jgi:hypothetical protein